MQFTLTFTKETKRTFRFDNEGDPDSDLRTLYIQQSAFPRGAPMTITVVINDE